MNETESNTRATADKELGKGCFEILENSKNLVRASLETYDETKLYKFLNFS